MNKNFREWYLNVNVEPQEGQVEKRIAAIKSYCEEINVLEVINLLKMYYGFSIDQKFKEEFVKSFIENDDSFSAKRVEELKLLAGATLVYLAENHQGMDSIVELFSISIHRFRTPSTTEEIYTVISENFDKDSINLRTLSIMEEQIKELPIVEFSKHLIDSGMDAIGIEKLVKIFDLIQKSFETLSNRVECYESLTSIYQEDSKILWWLMGEHCNQLNLPLKSIEKSKACLILGKEASDFITNYPGPHSILAVLNKMIEHCKGKVEKNSINSIIDNLSEEWKDKFIDLVKQTEVLDLLPISSAINRSKNTESSSEWYPKFKREIMSRDEEPTLTQQEYAWQMYIECLALKCFNNFNN